MQHVVHLSLYHHVPLNTVSNIQVYGIYHLICTAVILTYRKPAVGTAIRRAASRTQPPDWELPQT
jgi:hypothetical protein